MNSPLTPTTSLYVPRYGHSILQMDEELRRRREREQHPNEQQQVQEEIRSYQHAIIVPTLERDESAPSGLCMPDLQFRPSSFPSPLSGGDGFSPQQALSRTQRHEERQRRPSPPLFPRCASEDGDDSDDNQGSSDNCESHSDSATKGPRYLRPRRISSSPSSVAGMNGWAEPAVLYLDL